MEQKERGVNQTDAMLFAPRIMLAYRMICIIDYSPEEV
jgi:hypothetical protein